MENQTQTKLLNNQDYKVFEGIYNQQMPLLVKENYQPLTTKDIMLNRIKAIQSKDQGEINFWLNQYFNTADGVAYYHNKLIVIPNSELLLNINQGSRLGKGSLVLSDDQYSNLSKKYEVFNINNIKYENIMKDENRLTKQQAKEHPIWLKLAQDDKSLLNEYTDLIFAKAKEVYDHNKNMGVHLRIDEIVLPSMRLWCLGNLSGGSDASNCDDLDYFVSRLLGVHAQNLEQIVGKTVLDL